MLPDTVRIGVPYVLLVTRHGKARAIAPPLRSALSARVALAVGVNTDEVRRKRPSADCVGAALAKINAGFESVRYARFAIASAGEFTPDPGLPNTLVGSEVVVLAERGTGRMAVGRSHIRRPDETASVEKIEDAVALASDYGFPSARRPPDCRCPIATSWSSRHARR